MDFDETCYKKRIAEIFQPPLFANLGRAVQLQQLLLQGLNHVDRHLV